MVIFQTDLCGIKWRRLVSDNVHVDALDDPVLVGFSRCMNHDILCVWRRVQRDQEQRQPDFNSSKELWIFWYGDEPESLRQALSPDLGLKGNGPLNPGITFYFLLHEARLRSVMRKFGFCVFFSSIQFHFQIRIRPFLVSSSTWNY